MNLFSKITYKLNKLYQERDTHIIKIKRATKCILARVVNHRAFSLFAAAVVVLFIIGGVALSDYTASTPSSSSPSKAKRKSKGKTINTLITNQMSETEATKAFDREIESFLRRWEITGASFALMRNDSLLYAKGYGYANKATDEKMEVKHTLRLASASKLITATAIMKLIEQGKLTLQSKVFGEEGILSDEKFLNLQDKNMKLITVEHLMRHTAGFAPPITDPAFSNYSVARALDTKLPLSVDDMVVYATKYKLKGRPGDRYKYSNLGYIILGRVIEEVSGESYERYVQKNLLTPIDCHDMYIGKNFSHDRYDNEVEYYEVKEAELESAYDGSGKLVLKSNGGNNVTLLSSAGGWVASPVEMLRFVASVDGRGSKSAILSSESIRAMTTDSRKSRPMGWATVHGEDWIRSGSMAGTCTIIKREKNGYTWIFVTNSSAWIGYKLGNNISQQVTRAVSKVKSWPKRDMFKIREDRSQGEIK